MKTILAVTFFFLMQFSLFAQVTISFPKGEAGFSRDIPPPGYAGLYVFECALLSVGAGE